MSYTPPSGNVLAFSFSSAYDAPGGSALAFNFNDGTALSGVGSIVISPVVSAAGLATVSGTVSVYVSPIVNATNSSQVNGTSSVVITPTISVTSFFPLLGTVAVTVSPTVAAKAGLGMIGSAIIPIKPKFSTDIRVGVIGTIAMSIWEPGLLWVGQAAISVSPVIYASGGYGGITGKVSVPVTVTPTITARMNRVIGIGAISLSPVVASIGGVAASGSATLEISIDPVCAVRVLPAATTDMQVIITPFVSSLATVGGQSAVSVAPKVSALGGAGVCAVCAVQLSPVVKVVSPRALSALVVIQFPLTVNVMAKRGVGGVAAPTIAPLLGVIGSIRNPVSGTALVAVRPQPHVYSRVNVMNPWRNQIYSTATVKSAYIQ